MGQRTISIALALTASVLGVVSGTAFGQAPRADGCGRDRLSAPGAASAVMGRTGLTASVGGRTLVAIDGTDGRRVVSASEAGDGVVRHVASRAGSGTAYVLDRRGPDTVVIEGRGTTRLLQTGEATHPAWSPGGDLVWSLGIGLRTWSPRDGRTGTIAAPAGALAVFSPVFDSIDTVVAVVGEREPGFERGEDEGVDNLWRYDLGSGLWAHVTSFHATGDRMLAIRTPLVRADGSIELVVIRGDSSAVRMPSFELWKVSTIGEVQRLRALPREMYLAGELGGDRVWNIYDDTIGEWRLFIQAPSGRLVDLGCGAVAVDPRSVIDPDRGRRAGHDEPPLPSPTPAPTTPAPTTSPTVVPDPVDGHVAGILVGDFGSAGAAEEAMATIQRAFGGEAILEVVDSATAPNIVRPGVWAVVLLLSADADVLGALEDFRSRLPAYQDWSWVVSV